MKRALRAVSVLVLGALLCACASNDALPRRGTPKDAAHANEQLGVAYMQQGQMALAKEKLERAAKQDPSSVEVHTTALRRPAAIASSTLRRCPAS